MRPHKRGGAFCAYTVPSVHPYVMLNFTARRRDVLTMAHELGHGLHAALAQPQGVFQQSTPLTLAETASVFGEALVFGRLLDAATDDDARLGLLAERIDGAVATVFRQMAMNRFEHLVHTRRRDEGELSVRALRRVLGRVPGRAVRRLGRDHRRLPQLVVLRPALHQHPGLRLRLRLRAAAGALGLQPLRRARDRRSPRATWSCWPPAARAAPRSWRRSSASTWPTPASGTAGLTLVERAAERGRGAGRAPLGRLAPARQAAAGGLVPGARRVRERSCWRSTTLAISLSTCSIPVALASPLAKASSQSRDVALGGQLVELGPRHLEADLGVGGDVLGHLRARAARPGRAGRRRRPRSSSPATSFSGCSAGTSSRKRLTAVSISDLVSWARPGPGV